METSIVPGIYDPTFADRKILVDLEGGHAMARRLAQEEELFVGISAEAEMWSAPPAARELAEGVVVALFLDGREKYLCLMMS